MTSFTPSLLKRCPDSAMNLQINRANSVNLWQQTIPSQAAQAEGVTTRAKARSAKRREVPGPLVGEEIVCSVRRRAAACKGGYDIAYHTERKATTMSSRPVSTFSTVRPSTTTSSRSGLLADAEAPISRQCNVCGETRYAPDLVASKRYHGGYMPLCKSCRNEYWRKRRSMNPEAKRLHGDAVRRSRLLSDYGMTQADYKRMLETQDGKCKLCNVGQHGRGARFRYWNIDHDHRISRVRGLLCHVCNITIGKYENLVSKIGAEAIRNYLKE